jgi:serine/threonine protein kinase
MPFMNEHSIGLIVSMAAGTAPWIFGTNQVLSSDETNVQYVEGLVLRHPIINSAAKETIAIGNNPVVEDLIKLAGHGNDIGAKKALEVFCDTGELPANVAPQPPSSGTKIPLLAPIWLEPLVSEEKYKFTLEAIANNKESLEAMATSIGFDEKEVKKNTIGQLNERVGQALTNPRNTLAAQRAPEIVEEYHNYAKDSDIFSLGIILYCMGLHPLELKSSKFGKKDLILILSRCGIDTISLFNNNRGLLGVKRDVFLSLEQRVQAGGESKAIPAMNKHKNVDQNIRNLMGVSGESREWMDHPHHAFATRGGKKAYRDKTYWTDTNQQILQSVDLLNGHPADDVVLNTIVHIHVARKEYEDKLRETIQGWKNATTPAERKPFIKELPCMPVIVRNPDLQRDVAHMFPHVGYAWLPLYDHPDVVDIVRSGQIDELTRYPDVYQITVDVWQNITEGDAGIIVKLLTWLQPESMRLVGLVSIMAALYDAGLVLDRVGTLVVFEAGIPLLLPVDVVKQCFPKLKEVTIIIDEEHSTNPTIHAILDNFKGFGVTVNIQVGRWGGQETVYEFVNNTGGAIGGVINIATRVDQISNVSPGDCIEGWRLQEIRNPEVRERWLSRLNYLN